MRTPFWRSTSLRLGVAWPFGGVYPLGVERSCDWLPLLSLSEEFPSAALLLVEAGLLPPAVTLTDPLRLRFHRDDFVVDDSDAEPSFD